ncbi:MAG TPA: adenylate/guanylate cyclase domain-containing protein [Candidatus Limnocylindrales bacterium]
MTRRPAPTEEDFRSILTGEHPGLGGIRNAMKHIPSSPRCKLCAAPFGGAGGALLRHFGYAKFAGNPSLCEKCIREFQNLGVKGAEIPATLLFADIRGSTALGERMRPSEFRAYLDRFYRIGSDAIQRHDGLLDKFVGDEVIGLFFGGVSGPGHAIGAIRAAREILDRAAREDATPMGPIPVGIGVHTGEPYVGTTGPEGAPDDFTALGDVVNSAARLASSAAAGELLVSVDTMTAAGLAPLGSEIRTVEIRGREATIDVVVIRQDVPLAV